MPDGSPAPSEVLAARLLDLRNRHGWTQAELADRMTSYGWSWDRTTVAKIEARQRQVSVDEFVALSFVLGVPLAALVTPTASGAKVSVTPKT
jgi:transcriptional regulator with XRE-family HTH domain